MKLTVNGVEIPSRYGIDVVVEVEGGGETLPPISINVTGGRLEVYRSSLTKSGDIHIHPFQAEESEPA